MTDIILSVLVKFYYFKTALLSMFQIILLNRFKVTIPITPSPGTLGFFCFKKLIKIKTPSEQPTNNKFKIHTNTTVT